MTKYEVELTDEQARAVADMWTPGSYGLPVDQGVYALANAIRANPPKPPRMAEPGWGEKVGAGTGDAPHRRFVCILNRRGDPVWQDNYGRTFCWDDLIDPEPLP